MSTIQYADPQLAGPASAWDRFWFHPTTPHRLGLCRIIFFGGLFLFYVNYDATALGDLKASYRPVFLLEVFRLKVVGRQWLELFQLVWLGLMAMACVGLFTRFATVASLVLGAYLIAIPNSFGKVGHGDAILLWAMLAFACSRCGDACSLDAVIRRRLLNRPPPPALSGEYCWPIRFMWIVMAYVFFAAGVAKLRTSGLEWMLGDSMQNQLLAQRYVGKTFLAKYFDYRGSFDPGLWVANYPWMCKAMATSAVVIELLMALAPFFARVRVWIVPLMALCQLGMGLILGVLHPPFALCYLFWVPWDRLLRIGSARDAAPNAAETPAPSPALEVAQSA